MGRSLALGIASRVTVRHEKGWDIKNCLSEIESELGKYLNLSAYTYEIDKDTIFFKIRSDFLSDNIHELLKELCPIIGYRCLRYILDKYENVDILSEKFNSKDTPLILKYDNDGYLCSEDREIEAFYFSGEPKYWLFDTQKTIENFDVIINYIPLWEDDSKIFLESDSPLLYFLNTLWQTHFKNALANNCLFYIIG